MISAEDLHDAADITATFGTDEKGLEEYGLTLEALRAFIDGSDWRDVADDGPVRDMDELALAIGISIGVVAAARHLSERH